MVVRPEGKIGFALGGGVARGLFHIGVLSVLEENHIYPDIIVGTSMGAVIGALYASGLSAAEIKKNALELDWKQMYRFADIAMPRRGFIQGNRVTSFLKRLLKEKSFSQLEKKFACVATDIMTGEQVVMLKGSLVEALRASISMPAIFTPVKRRGRYLVDGGLVNVVPVSVCRDLGADYVIGVNVIPVPHEELSIQEACERYYEYQVQSADNENHRTSLLEHGARYSSHVINFGRGITTSFLARLLSRKKHKVNTIDQKDNDKTSFLFAKEPTLADVVSQSLSIVEYRIAMENLKTADMAITPFSGNIGFWQFNKVAEAISAGEIATRLVLQREDTARMLDGTGQLFNT
jgi:NTE family protein